MTVYQLYVCGFSKTFTQQFKMHSAKVFKNVPSEKDKYDFIKKCADNINYIDSLDEDKEYTLKVLKLELINN